MSTATVSDIATNGIAALEFIRGFLDRTLEAIPREKLTHQPFPGANHVLWNVGHLAVTDDYFCSMLSGRPRLCPTEWDELFGMGSEPKADASGYPAYEKLREHLRKTRAAFIDWYRSLDEAKLQEPMPEELRVFAPTFGALASSVAVHEGMHCGQILCVRKALGLKPVMG